MRRGLPLPIPNREVKPDCADGTAVMWESMSPPLAKLSRAQPSSLLKSLSIFRQAFLLSIYRPKGNGNSIIILMKINSALRIEVLFELLIGCLREPQATN